MSRIPVEVRANAGNPEEDEEQNDDFDEELGGLRIFRWLCAHFEGQSKRHFTLKRTVASAASHHCSWPMASVKPESRGKKHDQL